jgi:chromosome segregation ATPase
MHSKYALEYGKLVGRARALQADAESGRRRAGKLEADLRECRAEVDRLTAELAIEHRKHKTEADTKDARIRGLEAENSALQSRVQDLETKIREAKAELIAASRGRGESDATVAEERRRHRQELAEAQRKEKAATDFIAVERRAKEEALQRVAMLEAKTAEQERRYGELERRGAAPSEELRRLQQENENLKNALSVARLSAQRQESVLPEEGKSRPSKPRSELSKRRAPGTRGCSAWKARWCGKG